MKLTIDNLDGAGALDYTPTISGAAPLKVERALNAPSRCSGMLNPSAMPLPVRRARIVVIADNGTVLFTGYIATEPVQVYAGDASAGAVYHIVFQALSDEWLLDRQSVAASGPGLAQASGQVLKTLTIRVDAVRIATAGIGDGRALGVFQPQEASTWSANAGQLSSAAYAAYRVVNGTLLLEPAGTVSHTFSDGDGTLHPAALKTTSARELANDVTVSGDMEPEIYITEMFAGDGTTTVFQLAYPAFRPRRSKLLSDSFNTGVFDPRVWLVADPGSHLGFSAAGLLMTGGNGFDGQTTLTAIDSLEMGGSLVLEAGVVQLTAGSAGVLCGVYSGSTAVANCFAGYSIRQSAGNTVVTPMVNGAEIGTTYTIASGHSYTLRVRLHCAEMQRVQQVYYAMVDGVVEAFGGGLVSAPMQLVFELQDLGVSSNTPATVLYDGTVTVSPASCTFVAVNSVQLFGSMGYSRVTQSGSVWVVSTLSSGATQTRLIGTAGEGVDCTRSGTGKVTFLAGRVPVAGEFVTVTYRSAERSVARLENAASVATEAVGGTPGTARWLGHVLSPAARSSVDCESAASAILSFATSSAAALAGSYIAVNPHLSTDIWPGDVLSFTSAGIRTSVVVRSVTIEEAGAAPEALTYRITFANDWAEALGMRLSEKIAADALLPQTALGTPGNVLANLQQLQVVSATGTALQVDAGTAPPAGGGFEVRRRDGDFGPGVDQDLVLRSPVQSFSIPREGQVERYFVRMYDASAPPLYSRFSSAVFTSLPVS